MNLIIDNSNLMAGGGIQVAISFLKDLKKLDIQDNQYHIVQSPYSHNAFGNESYPDNFYFYSFSIDDVRTKRSKISKIKKIENTVKPDAIFTVFGPSYHKSNYPKIVGFAIPYIIYPNSPFFKLISIKEKFYYKALTLLKSYCFKKNSEALIFESENARKTFSEKYQYNKDTFVVSNTINEIFENQNKWKPFHIENDNVTKILYLTANYLHKNLKIIPDVIDVLRKEQPDFKFRFYVSVVKKDLGFSSIYDPYIEYLGKVDITQIPSIYQQIDVVFMPTLLEVFSTTYLEAMFMKKPIIASDMSFARDICHDAAIFCEPTNPNSYADAIFEIINNENLYNSLIEKGTVNLKRFGNSMDRTKAYLAIIENTIINENKK